LRPAGFKDGGSVHKQRVIPMVKKAKKGWKCFLFKLRNGVGLELRRREPRMLANEGGIVRILEEIQEPEV